MMEIKKHILSPAQIENLKFYSDGPDDILGYDRNFDLDGVTYIKCLGCDILYGLVSKIKESDTKFKILRIGPMWYMYREKRA